MAEENRETGAALLFVQVEETRGKEKAEGQEACGDSENRDRVRDEAGGRWNMLALVLTHFLSVLLLCVNRNTLVEPCSLTSIRARCLSNCTVSVLYFVE